MHGPKNNARQKHGPRCEILHCRQSLYLSSLRCPVSTPAGDRVAAAFHTHVSARECRAEWNIELVFTWWHSTRSPSESGLQASRRPVGLFSHTALSIASQVPEPMFQARLTTRVLVQLLASPPGRCRAGRSWRANLNRSQSAAKPHAVRATARSDSSRCDKSLAASRACLANLL